MKRIGGIMTASNVSDNSLSAPEKFQAGLIEKARANKKRIVMPEGSEERTLQAVAKILQDKVADITLLGNEDTIRTTAKNLNADIGQARIIDPAASDKITSYSETLYELRKHKGMSPEDAKEKVADPIMFGTLMVQAGDADGLVAGAIHATSDTVIPALQVIKTQKGISLVSSVFFMCLPDNILVYADCAINPNPTAEQLAEIAISSADTAAKFGIEPRVAMLSYSTGSSGKGPDVETVIEATSIAQSKRPDLLLEGPLQYDAACSMEVAKIKLPDSKVAGKATVFIFPSLEAGNITYKAVQRSANIIAIGPVLQGLNKPANALSRGCLVEDIIYTVVVTAIQA